MTTEVLVPWRVDASAQFVTQAVPASITGDLNVPSEISRIRHATGYLQGVQEHVRHRPDRQGNRQRSLPPTAVASALLDAGARYGEGVSHEDVVASLRPFYGEASPTLADKAQTLWRQAEERTALHTGQLSSADEYVVYGEADKVQRRFARKTGVDPSVFEGHTLPKDKVQKAKLRKYGSMALNAGSQAASFGVGWATKDYNFFDFQDRAASIAAAVATYVPLAGALVYYGKENLKQIKEKGISLVYLSKMLYERSLLKGGGNQQKVDGSKPRLTKAEKRAQAGYGMQEGGIESAFAATAVATESFTFWAMSNIVSTALMGAKILGSRWYRLGFNEGIVQPVAKVAKKLKRQKAAA